MSNDKTRTNLSLDGADLEKKLHELAGSSKRYNEVMEEKRAHNSHAQISEPLPETEDGFVEMKTSPIIKVEETVAPEEIVAFDKEHNCYSYHEKENDKKKFWLHVYVDKIILITTQMPYGELADPSKVDDLGNYGYLSYFKAEEITKIIEHVKSKHPRLCLHVIIPRIEKGVIDDHIVIEYRPPEGAPLVIDSKPLPSGVTYDGERINTGRQDYTNAEDCGFHVIQTIPVLKNLIKADTEISEDNLNRAFENDGDKSFFLHKFEKLQDLYHQRVQNGDQKYPIHSLLCCFSFIFNQFGYKPSVKEAAVKQIIENIQQERSVVYGLTTEQEGAAKQGVLGDTVRAFLEAEGASSSEEYLI